MNEEIQNQLLSNFNLNQLQNLANNSKNVKKIIKKQQKKNTVITPIQESVVTKKSKKVKDPATQ